MLRLQDAFNRIRDLVLFLREDTVRPSLKSNDTSILSPILSGSTLATKSNAEYILAWTKQASTHAQKLYDQREVNRERSINDKQYQNIARICFEIQTPICSAYGFPELEISKVIKEISRDGFRKESVLTIVDRVSKNSEIAKSPARARCQMSPYTPRHPGYRTAA